MKVNSKVVSDLFDGEAVVVNLETGIYYSFKSTALDLWLAIEKGTDVNLVDAAFVELSSSQREEITQFINTLIAEGLLVSTGEPLQPTSLTIEKNLVFEKIDYAKFNDMADLIMIDPIHEADEQKGWPNKAS